MEEDTVVGGVEGGALITAGFLLMIVGFLLLIIGILGKANATRTEYGAVIFIGPFPLIWASSREAAATAILLAVLSLIVLLLLLKFL